MIVGAVLLSIGELALSVIRRNLTADTMAARLRLAQRLVLAIEFLIAADILKTIRTPTLEGMALLGAIIAVRTVLSLSIAYELRKASSNMTKPSAPAGDMNVGCTVSNPQECAR
jgi:uncharacterized membrane protein